MGKTAVAIDLTPSERGALESLAWRRKTAQGLAQRARIVLLAAEGGRTRPSACGWARRPTRSENGGGGSPNIGWRASMTEPRPGALRQIGDDEVAEVVR